MNFTKMQHTLITAIVILVVAGNILWAHCQVPCGIYNDKARIVLLREHVTTMEKGMNSVKSLSAEGEKNYNQLVRWVMNKEDHANQFQEIVLQYFLAQRIKPVDGSDAAELAAYQTKVTLLHHMIVYAMKCKQTTDQENINKLRGLIDQFVAAYFSPEDQQHLQEHHK